MVDNNHPGTVQVVSFTNSVFPKEKDSAMFTLFFRSWSVYAKRKVVSIYFHLALRDWIRDWTRKLQGG